MQFLTFLFRGRGFENPVATYSPEDVAVLASMLAKHGGHTLSCAHDGFEMPDGVRGLMLPPVARELPDYLPKVWAWSPQCHSKFSERFAVIDLDVVVLADLARVLATEDPIRVWDSAVGEPYNTSLFTVEPGAGTIVWLSMTAERVAKAKAKAKRWTGDQSWLAHALGPELPTFGEDAGVIRYRRSLHAEGVPKGTKAVFFCGPYSPKTERERAPWVMNHWH